MTGVAIGFLLLSIVLVWGGLVASSIFLSRRPDRADYPPGGIDDHREDAGIIEHDT
ncbi:methionine/alanine import family NSS transporter small subunit [Microbacterium sp.]|uniref:methionine/alanine import family NSS transporter small subunit n=1 Tax=Microbacterium sp. TaxID=51671 RepID=UPI0037C9C842